MHVKMRVKQLEKNAGRTYLARADLEIYFQIKISLIYYCNRKISMAIYDRFLEMGPCM